MGVLLRISQPLPNIFRTVITTYRYWLAPHSMICLSERITLRSTSIPSTLRLGSSITHAYLLKDELAAETIFLSLSLINNVSCDLVASGCKHTANRASQSFDLDAWVKPLALIRHPS